MGGSSPHYRKKRTAGRKKGGCALKSRQLHAQRTCSGVWKEMENRRETACPVEGITEWMNPRTPFPRKAIQRIRELIQTQQSRPSGSGPLSERNSPPLRLQGRRRRRTVRRRNRGRRNRRTRFPKRLPERIQQRAPCPAGREERHTGIRTFHTDGHGRSDAEDAAGELPSDDEAHPQRDTGVQGGDRNRRGTGAGQNHLGESGRNILPFEKEVYSEDAMEGIYVLGNAKAKPPPEEGRPGVCRTDKHNRVHGTGSEKRGGGKKGQQRD